MSMTPADPKNFSIRRPMLEDITKWIALLFAISAIATLFARSHWISDILANLRVQQCLVVLILLLVCMAFRLWRWMAVCVCCLAIHVPWFIAQTHRAFAINPNSKELTVNVSNVLTQNLRHEDIVTDVLSHNPDVFAILELSSTLAKKLQTRCGDAYPHSIVRPMDNGNFGIGLYSRHPFSHYEVFTLNTEIQTITATIQHHNERVRVIATHPVPPMGRGRFQLRNEHLAQLATMVRTAVTNEPETPIVLVGDLNLTPWSPLFADFENQSNLRRACDNYLITPTWYMYPTFPCGLTLDHVLISDDVTCTQYIVGPNTGSDHRSVTVTLAIETH